MIAQPPTATPFVPEPFIDEHGKIYYHEHIVVSQPRPDASVPTASIPLAALPTAPTQTVNGAVAGPASVPARTAPLVPARATMASAALPRPAAVLAAPVAVPLAPVTAEVSRAHGFAQGALLLAALQLLIGYEWLVSGADKLLSGTFPDHLDSLITAVTAGGGLPDAFATFLQQVVLPNSAIFGVAVECGETLTGVGLLMGALLTLVGPALSSRGIGLRRAVTMVSVLTLLATVASMAMGANYYLLDGMPAVWFQPGFAVGGAIDSGLFLALSSAVILLGRLTVRSNR